MKNDVGCFLITHGDMGQCLKRISEKLITQTIPISFYSNQQKTLEEIEKDILKEIKEDKKKNQLIFVDLAGGSCWMIANKIKRDDPEMTVISGVNIPMLVSFQINCLRLPWRELLDKIIDDAQKGIIKK